VGYVSKFAVLRVAVAVERVELAVLEDDRDDERSRDRTVGGR